MALVAETSNDPLISPGVFVEPRIGGWGATKYPSFAAQDVILGGMMDVLGINPLRLGRLLGMPNPGLVYQWTASHLTRPGPVYLNRCMALMLLHAKGLYSPTWWSIDWETGIITEKTKYGRSSTLPVAEKRKLPTGLREAQGRPVGDGEAPFLPYGKSGIRKTKGKDGGNLGAVPKP